MGFTISHDLHRLRRAIIDPYSSERNVLKLECVIEAKTTRLCQVIRKCRAMREPMNLKNLLLGTTMDIIIENSFADCYNLLDSEEVSDKWRETIRFFMKNMALINYYGSLPRMVESLPRKISQFMATDMSMIDSYKAVGSPTHPTAVFSCCLQYEIADLQSSPADHFRNTKDHQPQCKRHQAK